MDWDCIAPNGAGALRLLSSRRMLAAGAHCPESSIVDWCAGIENHKHDQSIVSLLAVKNGMEPQTDRRYQFAATIFNTQLTT